MLLCNLDMFLKYDFSMYLVTFLIGLVNFQLVFTIEMAALQCGWLLCGFGMEHRVLQKDKSFHNGIFFALELVLCLD